MFKALTSTRRLGLTIVAVAALADAGSAAYASIPDSSGVIHGCYKNDKGDLRVIDPVAPIQSHARRPEASAGTSSRHAGRRASQPC